MIRRSFQLILRLFQVAFISAYIHTHMPPEAVAFSGGGGGGGGLSHLGGWCRVGGVEVVVWGCRGGGVV